MSGLEFLEKLEIIRDNQITFGGYLLFVKDYCLISDVQVGRFKSEITIIDSISLNTDLFTETDETSNYKFSSHIQMIIGEFHVAIKNQIINT